MKSTHHSKLVTRNSKLKTMIIINQGKPNSGFFAVAQPGNSTVGIGDEVECRHPKTGQKTTGVCADSWTLLWAKVPDSFCILTYGINAQSLKNALETSFPDFRGSESVKFLLIKQN